MAAAWNVWKEMLTADQVSSEKIATPASKKTFIHLVSPGSGLLHNLMSKWGIVPQMCILRTLRVLCGRSTWVYKTHQNHVKQYLD